MIRPDDAMKITGLIRKIGIRTKLNNITAGKIVRTTLYDKKNTAKKVNYVLPTGIGKVALDVSVKEKIAIEAIEAVI